MNNPILNQSSLNNAKKVMDLVRASRDPKLMLQEMAKTNSNVREAMDLVNKAGDPRSAFYQFAAAKGVDPEAILSMIRK